jgi:hypothetical protein
MIEQPLCIPAITSHSFQAQRMMPKTAERPGRPYLPSFRKPRNSRKPLYCRATGRRI